MKNINIPEYVLLEDSLIALRLSGRQYYRHAGAWSVSFKIKDGILIAHSPKNKQLHEVVLIETTKKVWEESNWGYI